MKNRIVIDFDLGEVLGERGKHYLKTELVDFIKNHDLTYYSRDISVSFESQSQQKELKPCPFCGGKITCSHPEQLTFHLRRYRYKCDKCGGVFFFTTTTQHKSEQGDKKEAIKIWNQRCY